MSGSSLPYHLRTNKAIDRKIFFDLLSHLSPLLPNRIQEYKYISMGGPMLEDHHVLHYDLGMTKLLSIERDIAALSRQNYNKPFGCISCIQSSSRDFINNYSEEDPIIIWLDYTDTKWSSQFAECSALLNNLKEYDLFKVSFNANPDMLSHDSAKSPLTIFKEKANHPLLCENLTENDVKTMPNMAKTILEIFESITQSTLGDDGLIFYPLLQFRYIDNRHQMLTITGIVIPEDNDFPKNLFENSKLAQWPYLHTKWGDIQEINVPVLTQKEKHAINQFLPFEQEELSLDSLPFTFDRNNIKAKKMIENYVKYYRYIPNFQKVFA